MSKLFIICIFLLTAGCADILQKEYGAETYVYSFEEMGCSSSFTDITLGRFASTIYDTEVVMNLNCNSDTTVRVELYDRPAEGEGHADYFLVNNSKVAYEGRYPAYQPAYFTFKADPAYAHVSGTFYGAYRVLAINHENGKYTYRDYIITAFDNYGKVQAPSLGRLSPKPEKVFDDENLKTIDNATLN